MEEIAQVYARSLFEVAKEHGKLEVVREQLGQFADALDQNRDLATFFFSPYFSTEEKKDGLGRVLDGADPTVLNFLRLLVDNHRLPVIFRARRAFEMNHLWPLITQESPSRRASVRSPVGSEPATSGSVIAKQDRTSPAASGRR